MKICLVIVMLFSISLLSCGQSTDFSKMAATDRSREDLVRTEGERIKRERFEKELLRNTIVSEGVVVKYIDKEEKVSITNNNATSIRVQGIYLSPSSGAEVTSWIKVLQPKETITDSVNLVCRFYILSESGGKIGFIKHP